MHPNQLAIDYIWQKFSSVWIHQNSEVIMDEVDAIQKGLAHRPFNAKPDAHLKFTQQLQKRLLKLQKGLPDIQF